MRSKQIEYAKIEISVTTAGGILPVSGAVVAVIYDAFPWMCDYGKQIRLTDQEGKAGVFELPVCRAVIGDRQVDFPRRAECGVEIYAEGYVTFRVRGIHLFPSVTVKSSFDLLPKTECDDIFNA